MLSPATENATNKTLVTPISPHLMESSKTECISDFSDRPIATCTQDPSACTLQPKAPPKLGFIPRETTIQLREDIRRIQLTNTPASHIGDLSDNTNTLPHIADEYTRTYTCSSAIATSNVDHEICSPYEEMVDTVRQPTVHHMQPTCKQFPDVVSSQNHKNATHFGVETDTDFGKHNCSPLGHSSTPLSTSGIITDTQFDSLRSEAELTCY